MTLFKKKYLISGIGPNSYGGVGRLMYKLIPLSKSYNFRVLFVSFAKRKLDSLLKEKRIIQSFLYIIECIFNYIFFKLQLLLIKNSEIILIHPQRIGYGAVIRLIKNKNKIKIYVVDSSFFCIEGMNYDKQSRIECLRCLKETNCFSYCLPSTPIYTKEKNIYYIKELKKYSNNIIFYAQNNEQAQLLKQFYGENTIINVIGLDTGEFDEIYENNNEHTLYPIVYHGSLEPAKGIEYLLFLGEKLIDKNIQILIPYAKIDVEKRYSKLKHLIDSTVFIYKSFNWETGLKEIVQKANVVLCISIWSAPIEAALIKSLLCNGNVVVYDADCGFHKEIPDAYITRLNNNLDYSTEIFLNSINKKNVVRSELTKKWTKTYLKLTKIDRIFQ